MSDTVADELSRLRWRCRRGLLELDILLNGFLDERYEMLNADKQALFDSMLDYPDQVLLNLLMGNIKTVDCEVDEMVQLIREEVVT